ncbi:helix-hairpin-helix domain-containing protein [uncultured Methanobrevibacter sp.]|uniref:helix-hairpin-helix domain-containing protein n=1 Tax=uncultured Methanobrevibacter sp. TaxID=253161 RepID=UPI0025EFD955|nr:helix-hairpin-helix domain-containing protein [uncultured Methanobrevibacter sp.]
MEHFGNVSSVFNASENELQEVEGIGEKTAKSIREVIDSKYLFFQKEIKEKRLL